MEPSCSLYASARLHGRLHFLSNRFSLTNSLVGANMIAPNPSILFQFISTNLSSIGITNASVFPLPVCASASTSFPCNANGNTNCCICVGSVNEAARNEASVGSVIAGMSVNLDGSGVDIFLIQSKVRLRLFCSCALLFFKRFDKIHCCPTTTRLNQKFRLDGIGKYINLSRVTSQHIRETVSHKRCSQVQ